MRIGTSFGSASPDRSTGLALLFLLLGVLAPTACVLWFMNEAARSQAAAARQSVTEAYRSQLPLLRDRVDSYWQARFDAIPKASDGGETDFLRTVVMGLADSVVYLDPKGVVIYPSPLPPIASDPVADRPDWRAAQALEGRRDRFAEAAAAYDAIAKSERDASIAARAGQARIRCLLRGGDREAAIRAIQNGFAENGRGKGRDLQGRSIAADEQLLLVHLLRPADKRHASALTRLVASLNDYRTGMPSAQRIFLMGEVKALAPDAVFPTYQAERLASQFLETDVAGEPESGLQPSRTPGLWKFTQGRAIALYLTGTVVAGMSDFLDRQSTSRSVRFAMVPPGAADGTESIPAGPRFPGWRISFSLLDTKPFDDAARSRRASYLWAGYLIVALMALTGLLAGQFFRRQLQLAHLKSDLVATVSHELKTPLSSMRLLVDTLLDDAVLDTRKTREYLELMARENARLSLLIGNFLAFSRMERSRYSFEFAPAKVEDVVKAVVEAAGERFAEPGCQLRVEVAPDLPEMRADMGALVTALVNLLDNAYKYTPGEKHITLRAFAANREICFEVSDNGIGIEPREIKRIFRKFYQADRRLSRTGGGCGLGLSIVRFLVEAHGGSVRVSSQPGSGSRFTVALGAA